MKFLPTAVTVTCAALLCSCGKQTAATESETQRIAEEQQAEALSQLHEKEAALDERERVLDAREQQLTISPQPPEPETAPSSPAPAPAQAAPSAPAYSIDATYQNFYDILAPYGSWLAMDPYGYVWQPSATLHDINWRPYTIGHWAYTDNGWTWMSDEPFGWITYHYGRWMRTHTLGWVWTPGDDWAPAWVSWRYGNDFVGWAPLPPEARFDGATGIKQWADTQYDLGASDYTFVPASDFGEGNMADVEVPPDQTGPIYDESNNETDIFYDSGAYAIICYGPSYDFMRSKSRRPLLPPLTIRRYGYRHDGENGPSVSGNTLHIPAPLVVRSQTPGRPANVSSLAIDARLINPPNPPPPHGAPVPPLYQPPVRTEAVPPVARRDTTARQDAAPGDDITPPERPVFPGESGHEVPDYIRPAAPPPPPQGVRFPSRTEQSAAPAAPEGGKPQDVQIIEQQQAARAAAEAQQRAEEQQAQQRAQEQRVQEQQAQEQRASELRAEESVREQHAAEEAASAAAAREAATRQEAVRSAPQTQSAPAATQAPAK